MKTRLTLLFALIMAAFITLGQRETIELTFTAIDDIDYVPLDSIKIMNRTQGTKTVIAYPDTTVLIEITPGDLLLYVGYSAFPVGIPESDQKVKQFQVFQSYPNPVKDQSMISMYLPEKGTVNIMITDSKGSVSFVSDWQLDQGNHTFRFIPGNDNFFILTAWWNGLGRSIKILTAKQHSGKKCNLIYTGGNPGETVLKALPSSESEITEESGILDFPETSKTYTFQFATNIPCPGTPTVEYEGQVYNTVQICSQCWLKENLNVGMMIPGGQYPLNNGIIEKYCYNNEPDSCTKYGGLYQWDEMMQYTTQQGSQGICPPGWHLPTVEEWRVLDGVADTYFGIGDPIWNRAWGSGAYNAGNHLKTKIGWESNCTCVDRLGFSGMGGGVGIWNGNFLDIGQAAFWWTSTLKHAGTPWGQQVYCSLNDVWMILYGQMYRFSARCIRDE